MTLWTDLDPSQRVTKALLLECEGASDKKWLAKQFAILDAPRCPAAVIFRDDKYLPCRHAPLPGETFCHRHGGAKRSKNALELQRLMRLVCRLEHKQRATRERLRYFTLQIKFAKDSIRELRRLG